MFLPNPPGPLTKNLQLLNGLPFLMLMTADLNHALLYLTISLWQELRFLRQEWYSLVDMNFLAFHCILHAQRMGHV